MKIFKFEKRKNRVILYLLGIKFSHKFRELELKDVYDKQFFSNREPSYISAINVIKTLKDILPDIKSVLDVGCGNGTWLKVWGGGNINIYGLDGNELPPDMLYVDRSKIGIADLTNLSNVKLPNDRYDLVESLEVGEHLPEQAADEYVKFMCDKSDLILFSAAIPQQGGVNHINEQPPRYWAEKFAKNGFKCFDIVRKKIWNDKNITYHYRQNILIFAKNKSAEYIEKKGYESTKNVDTVIHPGKIGID